MRQVTTYITITGLAIALMACDNSQKSSANDTAEADTAAYNNVSEQKTPSPSFDCSTVSEGSIEAVVCQQPELAQLDNQLSHVYQQALNKAENSSRELKAMQRGWLKGRDDCWKSSDKPQCIKESYQQRIAELQARYRLVDSNGPLRFICDNNPKNEFIVTFFNTEPRTLIAERGDHTSLMYNVASGSGAKYQGQNETFWEHQGKALITWGYQAPELTCQMASSAY